MNASCSRGLYESSSLGTCDPYAHSSYSCVPLMSTFFLFLRQHGFLPRWVWLFTQYSSLIWSPIPPHVFNQVLVRLFPLWGYLPWPLCLLLPTPQGTFPQTCLHYCSHSVKVTQSYYHWCPSLSIRCEFYLSLSEPTILPVQCRSPSSIYQNHMNESKGLVEWLKQ
jgi:hypothetical protein